MMTAAGKEGAEMSRGREPQPRETIETEEQAQRYAMQYAEAESRKVRKRPDSQARADSSEVNSIFLNHNLHLMQYPALSIHSSAAEIRNRIALYFNICDQDGMRATIAGLSLALGIDRRRLWEINTGKVQVSKDIQTIIQRAYQLINSQLEGMMLAGQAAPVPSIFLLKAQFAYEDTHKIEINNGSREDDTETPEEIEEKIKNAITDFLPEDFETEGGGI